MITLIAAVGKNNELGKDNQLLWHLPDDFKRFKSITSGHHIIMGRKTFESFLKPLPNRTHIIITKNKNYNAPEGCIVVHSLEAALDAVPENQNVFVIGGGEIYKQSISIADSLDITRVDGDFEADTFFPEIDSKKWKLTQSTFHDKDEKHSFAFTFETYHKI